MIQIRRSLPPTTRCQITGERIARAVGVLHSNSLEWTYPNATVRLTTALHPGRYVRLDDSERGISAQYPQICRGDSRLGATVCAPGRAGDDIDESVLASHVAAELGVVYYRTLDGYTRALDRIGVARDTLPSWSIATRD